MQSALGHLQFNIARDHIAFYRDMLAHLGWKLIHEDEGMLGAIGDGPASLWFTDSIAPGHTASHDGPGLNHIAFAVGSVADVDASARWLKERGVPALYETPRHRPEFSGDPQRTYYQVMFKTPDQIQVEVVYMGLK